MYLNTTYKAFVAEAAAKVAASIAGNYVEHGNPNDVADEIAETSVVIAEKLAAELETWWNGKDQSTVMFDVQDSLTSKMEGWLSAISENLERIVERI